MLVTRRATVVTTTSISLLGRAREGDDSHAWQQFNEVYAPLLKSWLARYRLQASDADDVVQETLLAVAKELPNFEHSGNAGAFRSWLRQIMVFRLRHFWRSRQRHPQGPGDSEFLNELAELEDPDSPLTKLWEREHDRHVLQRLLTLVEPRFQPSTREAFRRVAIDGQPAQKVADELGLTLNAVVIAKSRVLRELRREGHGLFDP
jgi:RNA polymerase sigma-70 factor (ECF subfamily)